ncbi:hypothetical protein P3T76_015114 [Phytophthora citrophthora]|uniref:Uncharacterized protein n=1 Tax=Phytophthora citrophthora TaxID=4793 RepID=A0AAD9LBB7_9STRA|nr:hypothetical protein P3T76_015114 [Phytophthora citrophthora]
MESAAKIAKQALEKDQLRRDRYHSYKVRNNVHFKVGDMVWIFRPPRGTGVTKLAHQWIGPAKISTDGGFDNWIVRREDTGEELVAHCSFLVSYYRPRNQLSVVADEILEDLTKDDELFGDGGQTPRHGEGLTQGTSSGVAVPVQTAGQHRQDVEGTGDNDSTATTTEPSNVPW